MNYVKWTVLVCALLFCQLSFSQERCRIISYNVENLFDCEDDPLTRDEDFTEGGAYHWTPHRYKIKLNNIAKAITAAGEWERPILIGLCEVENATVVSDLLERTQLKSAGYRFLHHDSPDARGIDVALLYLPEKFKVISEKPLRVKLPERTTRDILYASGVLPNGDTLHVFVNHWPSRYGGELESLPNRIIAASVLKHVTDSLFSVNRNSKIIIMGDFNDYPFDVSLTKTLGSITEWKVAQPGKLYDLCAQFDGRADIGSHKFEGKWGMLDHFIVSGSLLNENEKTFTHREDVSICHDSFLLKKDKTGEAPKRSFLGTFFTGGFSDHLPVRLDVFF